MGKSAPKAPDYTAAAEKQAESSREVTEQQTWANRPDQTTPWGQVNWESTPTYDPTTGQTINRWSQTETLTPELQEALDAQFRIQGGRSDIAESMLGRARDEFGDAVDWSQFTDMGGIPQAGQYSPEDLQRSLSTEGLTDLDPSQRYYQEAGDAIYGQATSRLDPQWQQREQQQEARLRNQGLKPGDEAYDTAMQNLARDRTDAYQQAQYGATMGAGSEAQRMLGMDASTRGQMFGERGQQGAFYNQAADQALNQNLRAGGQQFGEQMSQSNLQTQQRQQQIAEELQRRGLSLNEINALLTGQQVGTPNMPGFNTAQASQGNQALTAANMTGQANLDAFNAQQAGVQGLMGGAASMGLAFSDRRLKKNIKHLSGRWYEFEYLWSSEKVVGVMADENPDAAVLHPSGYLMVDYGRIS